MFVRKSFVLIDGFFVTFLLLIKISKLKEALGSVEIYLWLCDAGEE
jgi:hypothetical protein